MQLTNQIFDVLNEVLCSPHVNTRHRADMVLEIKTNMAILLNINAQVCVNHSIMQFDVNELGFDWWNLFIFAISCMLCFA
jgi:hypothetical protein